MNSRRLRLVAAAWLGLVFIGCGGGSDASAAAGPYALKVTLSGPGTIESTPAGIDCGDVCSASFDAGTSVTLKATAPSGFTFAGWSGGGCSGTGACTVAMSVPRSVEARFKIDSGLDGACSNFYAKGFELVSGKVTVPWTASSKPTRGAAQRETAFNTCEVRVTNHRVDGLEAFARNDYSRRQAFNADNTLQLVYAYDGSWHLYDTHYRHFRALPGVAGDAEPQWHPTNRNVVYYLPTNGVGMKVYRMNVMSGQSTLVGDLASRLKARWPAANSAWTRSEGSPSADLRYWCFLVDSASWSGLGLVTWDSHTDTILGMMDLKGSRPDHVSMSPSGNYCVASSYGGPGVVVYARDFSSSRKIANIGEHSDIGIDANGDDAFVSVDYQAAAGDIYMVNLRTGVRTSLLPSYIAGTSTAMHFSAKAFRKPGWFVLSTYSEGTNNPPYVQQWLHRKIAIVQMAANPKIYDLAHTQVDYNGYWTEPQASVNRDLTKIAWTANWNVDTDMDVDTYEIQIPADSVK